MLRHLWLGSPISLEAVLDVFDLYGQTSYLDVIAYVQMLVGPAPAAGAAAAGEQSAVRVCGLSANLANEVQPHEGGAMCTNEFRRIQRGLESSQPEQLVPFVHVSDHDRARS